MIYCDKSFLEKSIPQAELPITSYSLFLKLNQLNKEYDVEHFCLKTNWKL